MEDSIFCCVGTPPGWKKRFNNNLILRGLDLSFQQKNRFSNHFYGYFSLIVGFVFIKVSISFCDKFAQFLMVFIFFHILR